MKQISVVSLCAILSLMDAARADGLAGVHLRSGAAGRRQVWRTCKCRRDGKVAGWYGPRDSRSKTVSDQAKTFSKILMCRALCAASASRSPGHLFVKELPEGKLTNGVIS